MKIRESSACLLATIFLFVPRTVSSHGANHNRTLIINGQSTQVPVIQVNGRSYVDLEGLASRINGSLSFSGNRIALSLPVGPAATGSATTAAKPASPPTPAPNPGFSKAFLNAG